MNTHPERKKIGLVLGGGGARGLAHIGVLKILQRENIPVDLIAGTSMGGIVGAIFAAGFSIEEIETTVLHFGSRKERFKLIDLKLTGSGLVKGTRIYRFMAGLLGEERTFADLKIPLSVVAVDILTGTEVVLNEGRVVDALRATMSVPGVFEPVQRGEQRLVDGGILNNVPVDLARQMGADAVIAVDVLPSYLQNQPGMPPVIPPLKMPGVPRYLEELMHVQMIMVSQLTGFRLLIAPPDVILRPELPVDMSLLVGFGRAGVAIAAGEAAAVAALPQIYDLLK